MHQYTETPLEQVVHAAQERARDRRQEEATGQRPWWKDHADADALQRRQRDVLTRVLARYEEPTTDEGRALLGRVAALENEEWQLQDKAVQQADIDAELDIMWKEFHAAWEDSVCWRDKDTAKAEAAKALADKAFDQVNHMIVAAVAAGGYADKLAALQGEWASASDAAGRVLTLTGTVWS